jgi:hypothetical protein
MPISQNFNIQWLAHNAQRSYPLTAEATGKDVTGSFSLPNDFLVSLYLSIPTSLNVQPASFMIRTIQSFATGFSVTVGYWNGSTSVPVAIGRVLRSTHKQNQSYQLRGIGQFYDVSGHMTIGQLDNIDLQPPGEWQFDLDGGRLEVDSIRPQIRGVTQVRVRNGTELSNPITGDVVIRAGTNMRVTVSEGDTQEIILSAINGEGLNEECECEGGNDPTPPIKSINGIRPGPDGSFTMLGSSCMDIQSITNGLRLDDKCAKPCCGCKELEIMTTAMESLGKQAETENVFLTNLHAAVTQLSQIVLGTRLGDEGCFS